MVEIEKPARLIVAENKLMAGMITNHFMNVLKCKDVHELIKTCETIIDAAKQTNYYLAE